jgi:Holliday junction resolvase RusA-like endonuclease
MPDELIIRAIGTPARQGSKDFKGMRGGRPILVEADDELPNWRRSVSDAAQSAMRAHGWLKEDGPCEVWIEVYLERPRTVKREYPDRMGDGDSDKYARAVMDALSIAGVYTDDSRVIDHHCRKRWTAPGQQPGARIVVRALTEPLI